MPDRTAAQWDRLLAYTERRGFRAGEDLIGRGEVDRAIYIVVEGSLEARVREGRAGIQKAPAFWGLIVPALPLLFFLAPGLWRNVCPMATLNQTPRRFGFTRALTMPKWFREYGYVIGIGLFLAIVASRKVLFDGSGAALGSLIVVCLAAAFAGGVLLKGKSGWCSTMCPLLPVQRLYGQTPFLMVRNAHCRPCVGCVKNCYDFNPAAAYMADLYDTDPHRSGYRKLFAGAFPGLILACYTAEITTIFAAAALDLYYWFSFPILADRLRATTGVSIPAELVWASQGAIVALTVMWIVRTLRKETPYVEQAVAPYGAPTAGPPFRAEAYASCWVAK